MLSKKDNLGSLPSFSLATWHDNCLDAYVTSTSWMFNKWSLHRALLTPVALLRKLHNPSSRDTLGRTLCTGMSHFQRKLSLFCFPWNLHLIIPNQNFLIHVAKNWVIQQLGLSGITLITFLFCVSMWYNDIMNLIAIHKGNSHMLA